MCPRFSIIGKWESESGGDLSIPDANERNYPRQGLQSSQGTDVKPTDA